MSEAEDHPCPEGERWEESALRESLDPTTRAALPFVTTSTPVERTRAAEWMRGQPAEQVAQALAERQVDQLVLLGDSAHADSPLPVRLVECLTARRLELAAIVMRQQHLLGEASRLLDGAGIEHVVWKGAWARQQLYAKPYLRPAADVDMLVAPRNLRQSIQLLKARGWNLIVQDHSDTHEVCLDRFGVEIDLHWSLLRPGRMRQDITAEILANRVRFDDLWRPSDTHLTVAMLVHPAITDYVTGRLISAVDLDHWLRQHPVCWQDVLEVLGRIGLRTAAWAMLRWTTSLFATRVPVDVKRALAPSLWRQRYIEAWLARHPAQLFARRPNLVRAGFSLALQDHARDAVRALWRLARKERLALVDGPLLHR
jgi:hypothetical protein